MARLTGKRRGQGGFTLIEVLIAAVVLGLAYVAILQNFSLSTRNIFRLEQKREDILVGALRLDEQLLDIDANGNSAEGSPFVEGLQYSLLLLTDNSRNLMTLKLVRK